MGAGFCNKAFYISIKVFAGRQIKLFTKKRRILSGLWLKMGAYPGIFVIKRFTFLLQAKNIYQKAKILRSKILCWLYGCCSALTQSYLTHCLKLYSSMFWRTTSTTTMSLLFFSAKDP